METIHLTSEETKTEQARFIARVYGWMCSALVVTGVIAFWAAATPAVLETLLANRILFYALLLGEFGCVMYLSSVIGKIASRTALLFFMLYACLNGLTFSMIFLIYTAQSISTAFFTTAVTFGVMSIYGYSTKRDLTSLGQLAFTMLIGLIIATVVNLFFANETISWIINYAGVLIFVGLTAYDTQKIKNMYQAGTEGSEEVKKESIMGALALYLDFINLFLFLLRFLGRRK